MRIEIRPQNRKTAFVQLNKFCHLQKEYSFMEVTEWSNGEGFDIDIEYSSTEKERLILTWGEFEALKQLVKAIIK